MAAIACARNTFGASRASYTEKGVNCIVRVFRDTRASWGSCGGWSRWEVNGNMGSVNDSCRLVLVGCGRV